MVFMMLETVSTVRFSSRDNVCANADLFICADEREDRFFLIVNIDDYLSECSNILEINVKIYLHKILPFRESGV